MRVQVSDSKVGRLAVTFCLAIATVFAVSPRTVVAQQAKPPAGSAAPAASVVDSPEWEATRQAYMEWLNMQQVYSQQEVQKMVADLQTRIAAMSEAERVTFLKETQTRLAVLNSDQAQQARAWLNANMARMTPAGQQKLLRQVPDVANMSAAELQQALAAKQMQVQARQRSQATTAQFRAQQNQMAMQMSQQRQQAFTDARQRQQSAVASQATNRVQQGFQQSQQNARDNNMIAPAFNAPLFNPYVWANPWVW